MVCLSCLEKLKLLEAKEDNSDWLSVQQVKEICEPCSESMIQNNITRIKKSVLINKFKGQSMRFYELIYSGPEKSVLHLHGFPVEAGSIAYIDVSNFQMSEKELRSIPNLKVNIIERDTKPTALEAESKAKAILGKVGVIWVGPSPMRVNEFGKFAKGSTVWVDAEVADKLIKFGGFKKV